MNRYEQEVQDYIIKLAYEGVSGYETGQPASPEFDPEDEDASEVKNTATFKYKPIPFIKN
jgi:hypothetical protein